MRPDFLTGAIDLHIHSAPDVIPRIGTSIDIAGAAARTGMRAVVFKDHVFPSFVKAVLTQQAVPEIRVFGGISLNTSVGGLNVHAVKGAIAAGCKVVMFPTLDSWEYFNRPSPRRIHAEQQLNEPRRAVRVTDDDGRLVPEAVAILELVAAHPDLILSNGHVGPSEAIPLFEHAQRIGIRRIMVEHPNSGEQWTDQHLLRLVELGAYLNVSFNPYYGAFGHKDPQDAVRLIRLAGAGHCTLITDGGQPYNAMPCETLRMFCELLYHFGLTVDEIFRMVKINPAWLLGLPEDG